MRLFVFASTVICGLEYADLVRSNETLNLERARSLDDDARNVAYLDLCVCGFQRIQLCNPSSIF